MWRWHLPLRNLLSPWTDNTNTNENKETSVLKIIMRNAFRFHRSNIDTADTAQGWCIQLLAAHNDAPYWILPGQQGVALPKIIPLPAECPWASNWQTLSAFASNWTILKGQPSSTAPPKDQRKPPLKQHSSRPLPLPCLAFLTSLQVCLPRDTPW